MHARGSVNSRSECLKVVDRFRNEDLFAIAYNFGGELLPGWSPSGNSLCPAPGRERFEAMHHAAAGTFVSCRVDQAERLLCGWFSLGDGSVPEAAMAKLVSHRISGRGVTSEWMGSGSGLEEVVGLAAFDGEALQPQSTLSQKSDSRFELTITVPIGVKRTRIMLGTISCLGSSVISDTLELSSDPAIPPLSLSMAPIQSSKELHVTITIGVLSQPVELAAFDLAGRRLASTLLRNPLPGRQTVTLELPNPRPGVVFVRARSGPHHDGTDAILLN